MEVCECGQDCFEGGMFSLLLLIKFNYQAFQLSERWKLSMKTVQKRKRREVDLTNWTPLAG
jgi:hypothetical protein